MRPLFALAALLAAGCTTVAPATFQVHPETVPNCNKACAQVGMKVSAIVFVENYGGCVCQPSAPTVGEAPSGLGAAASGAMVVIDAARKQQQEQQSRMQPSPTPTPSYTPHR